jgi:hypothetical protein
MQGIIDRSREVIGTRGRYNGSTHVWRLSDGRVIELAGVPNEEDKKRYQGRPADLMAFDEITEFTPTQYRFLIGWNRTTIQGQRCRVVCTGNPPTTAEGEWVIRYWGPWLDEHHPNPAAPGELRWFAVIDGQDVEVDSGEPFEHDGETIQPRSRTFIPARLTDNPYLLGTGYASVLQGMPEPLRSQMLYGDFKAGVGDDPWQVIPTEWVRAAQRRWSADRPDGPQTAVGVDVARGGDDKTVLARRFGSWYAELEKHSGSSTPDGQHVANLVLVALADGGVRQHRRDRRRCQSLRPPATAERQRRGHQLRRRLRRDRQERPAALRQQARRGLLEIPRGARPERRRRHRAAARPRAARRPVRAAVVDEGQRDPGREERGHLEAHRRSPDCGDAVVLGAMNENGPLLLWGGDEYDD